MKGSWTAGVTRGRLILDRTIGLDRALNVASRASLADGMRALSGSAYGERVHGEIGLAAAERAVAQTLLWHLRILAGWLPGTGAGLVRALAGWFELVNVDARLAALSGDGREPEPFVLGRLVTAWRRIEPAGSVEEIRAVLAGSPWGDPGGGSPAELALGLRTAWARRVREAAPGAADWVGGAGALLVAREQLLAGDRRHAEQLRGLPGIGDQALTADSLDQLRRALSPRAAWALAGVREPSDLWRAELAWWRRVEIDARTLLRTSGDEPTILAAAALLALDARRTASALAVAARGGAFEPRELIGAAA